MLLFLNQIAVDLFVIVSCIINDRQNHSQGQRQHISMVMTSTRSGKGKQRIHLFLHNTSCANTHMKEKFITSQGLHTVHLTMIYTVFLFVFGCVQIPG